MDCECAVRQGGEGRVKPLHGDGGVWYAFKDKVSTTTNWTIQPNKTA